MAATKALVVSRAAWALTPGPVLSGAVEVTATIDHGTSYVSPVGQNMTNRLFQYVGFMIMATEDNTSVTIDLDGAGTNVASVVVLNRGESHLVNGGVKIGGSVTSTKPVQVNLVIGRYAGRYATDWFTLYPTSQWSDSYITPVGTAANGNQTFNYFYNPNATNITINYLTRVGSGSFSVPAGGVTQYQMPQASGARFTSGGGAHFFALCTAGANPASESAYDWGFTLLPEDGLTTEAVVGWGPGSSDGTVNGSPVWVTPIAATRVYVDYNGDRAGPLTDPNGNKYDVHYDLAALESKTIYDPDKDQTAMRLYTLSGVVISTAWGEDPAVAAAGNPYFDFGTTVLPFPVPVLRKTSRIFTDTGVPGLSVGDTLEYTIELDNHGLLPLGNTVVIDSLPTNMLSYVTNSTTLNGSSLPDSVSGTPFPLDEAGYTIPVILRGGTSQFKFRAVTLAGGNITNVVSAVGYSLVASAVITPPAGGGSTQCGLNFANAAGTTVVSYAAGSNIFVRLTDADANTSPSSQQTVSVVVRNLTSGDLETITLTETGNNTGIFQNTSPLPSSVSAGQFQQDGILNAVPGDSLSVSYTDPIYADACSGSAVIQVPALTKVLYLSGTNSPDQILDRIDPVATGDGTTASSINLGSGGGGPGVVSLVSSNINSTTANNVTAFTNSNVTVGSISNGLLLVAVSFNPSGGGNAATNVTFGGQALTLVTNAVESGRARTEIWRLLNPPASTANVIVQFDGGQNDVTVGVMVFSGVNQTTPFTSINAAHQNSATPTLVVASQPGDVVFNVAADRSSSTMTPSGASQAQVWSVTSPTDPASGGSITPGATSVTNTWTVSAGSAQ